jgi:hypothetical protein
LQTILTSKIDIAKTITCQSLATFSMNPPYSFDLASPALLNRYLKSENDWDSTDRASGNGLCVTRPFPCSRMLGYLML